MSYQILVLGMDDECHEEQVSISRVLKYRDILEYIDIETACKLKNKYNYMTYPKTVKLPIINRL